MQRNRLAEETSPYLLQHADNPVDWYPWGEMALARAKREHKPILLSIGYSACHWCHVMAHESFEDHSTAALMNELFVNIKVDREERPDLDKIYQVAQQMITQGSGGWPLTMFLNPLDQQPFFGGTYFPKEPRYGMPAFSELLKARGRVLPRPRRRDRDPELALKAAFAALAPQPLARRHSGRIALAAGARGAWGVVRSGVRRIHPSAEISASQQHRTLPAAVARTPRPARSPTSRRCTWPALTLTRMAQGGLYDQLGGGFSRYSVDGTWTIPHFEKMLYDNAQLLCEYSRACLATGEALVCASCG